MHSEISSFYQFGKFRLDLQKKVLWYEEEIVSLPLKAVELLVALTEKGGEVIGKNELLEKVWKESFVEESNLSHNIYLLRKTLKSYDGVDYIQTLPRRGYRFSGEIVKDEPKFAEEEPSLSVQETTIEKVAQPKTSKSGNRKYFVLPLIFIVLIAIGVIYGVWNYRKSERLETVRSIAILPLKSFDENAEDANLGLRITDALITRLGSLNQIPVRPTVSVAKFKNSEVSPLEIGKSLAVDAIVEGRIQREGERIRVTLQLLSVGRGEQLWSRQFDGEADKILSLQDEISANIAKTLFSSSADEQNAPLANQPTQSADAYENYLKGRYHWNTRTAEGFEKAIGFFEQAITLDPKFAEAYSGLSDAHLGLYDYGIKKADDTVPLAKTAVSRALQLKQNSSEAYSTLSAIQFLYDRDNQATEDSIKKSIEYNSQNAAAHMRYGWYLTMVERFDEALPNLENALRLDPTSPIIQTNIGYFYACSGKTEEADKIFQKVVETNPSFSLPRWYLAAIHFRRGAKEAMYENYLRAFELDYGKDSVAEIKEILQTKGETAALELWSKKLIENYRKTYFPPSNIALIFALQKDKTKALDWLEESEKQKDPWLLQIVHDPEYDFLRKEPRFEEILQKLKMK